MDQPLPPASRPAAQQPAPVVRPLPGAEPPHVRPKLGRTALGCAGAVLVVAAIIAGAILYAVARTGIVTIPFFSRFYHGPDVTRRIQAAPMSDAAFRALIAQRFAGGLSPASGSSTVRMSETELSGALRSVIANAVHGQEWDVRTVQIAVRPTDLELYARIDRGVIHPEIVARFVPVIAADGLRFEPDFFQVGDYPLPKSFVYPLLGYVFERDFGAWNLSFGEIKLRQVQLHDGVLELDLQGPH